MFISFFICFNCISAPYSFNTSTYEWWETQTRAVPDSIIQGQYLGREVYYRQGSRPAVGSGSWKFVNEEFQQLDRLQNQKANTKEPLSLQEYTEHSLTGWSIFNVCEARDAKRLYLTYCPNEGGQVLDAIFEADSIKDLNLATLCFYYDLDAKKDDGKIFKKPNASSQPINPVKKSIYPAVVSQPIMNPAWKEEIAPPRLESEVMETLSQEEREERGILEGLYDRGLLVLQRAEREGRLEKMRRERQALVAKMEKARKAQPNADGYLSPETIASIGKSIYELQSKILKLESQWKEVSAQVTTAPHREKQKKFENEHQKEFLAQESEKFEEKLQVVKDRLQKKISTQQQYLHQVEGDLRENRARKTQAEVEDCEKEIRDTNKKIKDTQDKKALLETSDPRLKLHLKDYCAVLEKLEERNEEVKKLQKETSEEKRRLLEAAKNEKEALEEKLRTLQQELEALREENLNYETRWQAARLEIEGLKNKNMSEEEKKKLQEDITKQSFIIELFIAAIDKGTGNKIAPPNVTIFEELQNKLMNWSRYKHSLYLREDEVKNLHEAYINRVAGVCGDNPPVFSDSETNLSRQVHQQSLVINLFSALIDSVLNKPTKKRVKAKETSSCASSVTSDTQDTLETSSSASSSFEMISSSRSDSRPPVLNIIKGSGDNFLHEGITAERKEEEFFEKLNQWTAYSHTTRIDRKVVGRLYQIYAARQRDINSFLLSTCFQPASDAHPDSIYSFVGGSAHEGSVHTYETGDSFFDAESIDSDQI